MTSTSGTGSSADFDVVVVGGGLAGLTAGMFAARYGHSTLVLESLIPGGHLVNVETIEDYPGFPEGIAGYDLCPQVQEQAEKFGATFALADVEALSREDDLWHVTTTAGNHTARAVIVASGSHPKPLGVPGEEKFHGRGISHCATCDGPFFRGKPVAVAGSGTHALQEALTLTSHASHVILLNPQSTFTAQQTYLDRAKESPKIEFRPNTTILEVLGDTAVSALRVKDSSGAESQLDLSAVFVYVGGEPNTTFLNDLLNLAPDGRIPTDTHLATTLPGLFAAGDVHEDSPGHAITAAGEGATAAISAHRYLTQLSRTQ